MDVILEYYDYLCERVFAVGAECASVDLTATTEHFWSSGPCDPIVSAGLGARFRLVQVDVPDWLVTGVKRGMEDGRWYNAKSADRMAAEIALCGQSSGWAHALRPLISKRGKFADSLRKFFAERGYLTEKQAAYV